MAFQHLHVAREHGVETVTLNRPDVRNAFNDAVIAELTTWAASVERAAPDGRPRVAVIAGAGKTFSAGADIAWMARTVGYSEAQNLRDAQAASRMFDALDRLPIPLVARIQGAAIGGGAGLVAVSDVAIAEDGAVFAFTEVRLGIMPAVISPFVIAKVGASAARALFLTGGRFSAARAREIGLVHEVTPPGGLDATVQAVLTQLLEGGPEALAAAKTLVAGVRGRPVGDVLDLTARAIAERRVSAEGQEGLRAFLEKRSPSWRG
jgi:methylglutaconyl-CoA hydratase